MIETVDTTAKADRAWRLAAVVLLGLAILVLILALLAGPGYRMQMIELSTAFTFLRWGGWTGIAVGILSVLGLVFAMVRRRRREVVVLAVAAVVCFAVFVPVRDLRSDAQAYPPIHDVTTDLHDSPEFVAIPPRVDDPLRVPARTEELEALAPQKRWAVYHEQAYGDLSTLELSLDPAEALDAAESVARDMGWEIVAIASAAGRLEATATTTWFGFKDDVVVRVRPGVGEGSRVDVRSVSRIGVSDLGANAKRIREFLERLESAAKSSA